MSGHSDFGFFNNLGASSLFYLGISRYCVSCLSIATWQSGNDIHDFCRCHLWCWWSLFSKYCIRPRTILYNITSEYNSTFVFFWCLASNSAFFKWLVSISDAKWTFAPVVLASSITSFLLLTFVRFHAEIFSNFSLPCPPLPLLLEFWWLEAQD